MFEDNYKSESDDLFEVSSTSQVNVSINLIEKCGVKVKDFISENGIMYYIPHNDRDLLAKKDFLKNVGFIVERNMIIKK